MVTFRNNNGRRNNFRRSDRNFKSNVERNKYRNNFSNTENFQRKVPGRNNHNAPKLIEKYNNLSREALSSGDKILSENYLQHADHFTRVLNEKESFKREKFLENRSENRLNASGENIEDPKKNSDKDSIDSHSDDNEIQNNENSQVEVN